MDISKKKANESKIKFLTCFNLFEEHLNTTSESFNIEKGIDIEAFKKLMIKNDMEEYTDLFLSTNWTQEAFERHYECSENHTAADYEHIKELTDTLILLLSNETSNNPTVTIQTSKNRVNISNKDIVESIIKGLTEDFEKNSYNRSKLTIEEAKEQVKNDIDKIWIDQWLPEGFNDLYTDPKQFTSVKNISNPEMIKDYADSHFISRKVSLELLNSLKTSSNNKKKAGAKPKNLALVTTIKQLSYLKRIDKFLKQNKVDDIEKFHLTDNDCKFIHDCLVSFKIMEDKSNNKITSTTPEKYIRTIMGQTELGTWSQYSKLPRHNINELKLLTIC